MKVVPMIKLWKLKNRVHRRVVRKRLGTYRCSACGNFYESVSWTESRKKKNIYIKYMYVLQLLCLTDL